MYLLNVDCLCSVHADFQENGQCSQDSMREDSFVSSTGADQFSEIATFSGSDSETPSHAIPSHDSVEQLQNSDSEPPPSSTEPPSQEEQPEIQAPSESCHMSDPRSETTAIPVVIEPVEDEEKKPATVIQNKSERVQEIKQTDGNNTECQIFKGCQRSASVVSRKLSTDSLSVSNLKKVPPS